HRPARGAADQERIFRQRAGERVRPARFPCGTPAAQLYRRELYANLTLERVDDDAIAGAQQPDRATRRALGGNMSDDEAMTAAGEAAVSDQCDLAVEAAPADGARRAQHLTHAGTAPRALPADHDHVPGTYATGEDRLRRALLALEHTGASFEALT